MKYITNAHTPELYNYHLQIVQTEDAFVYYASFSLDPECTDTFKASGSAPTPGACIDDVQAWREKVLNGDK